MACPNEKRKKSKTVCFRVTDEDEKKITAKQKLSGKLKAEFILEALLTSEVRIVVGKFESDRLAVEIKRLRELMEESIQSENLYLFNGTILECIKLLNELVKINKEGM